MTRINKNNYKNLNESIINMNGPHGNLYEQGGGGTGGTGGSWVDGFQWCLAVPTGPWCLNNYDFNGDGVVDVNDLLWWLANYGSGNGGTGGFAPPGGGSPSFGPWAPLPKGPFRGPGAGGR